MPRLQLKTKLVLAITAMVVALVVVFAYLYVKQVVRSRIAEAYLDGDFVCHEIFNSVRKQPPGSSPSASSVLSGLPNRNSATDNVTPTTNDNWRQVTGSLMQSIVGYSPIVYDAAITDTFGKALLHSDADLQGRQVPNRSQFERVLHDGLWHQIRIVYGKPDVYEIRMLLERGGAPFGDIRVGISTTFMKNELRPQLNSALLISAVAILVSLVLAAGLSNIVLRPLEAIGERLDRMSAGEFEPTPPAEVENRRSDEYGVVTIKIDRLGRQMRDVREVFSALKENLDQIMANLQDGLMLFTRDARLVLVSASAEQFAGRPRGEILGRQVEEVFTTATPLGRLVLAAFQRHQPISNNEFDTGDGRRIWVALDFIEEGGEDIGALLTMRDTESVRRIGDEIELSRRLAAIGRLTSGVAHEVKNPINAIVVHLEVLREKLPQLEPDAQRHMEIIGKEIQRLDRVVQTLVDFTRPVELKIAELDLNRLLEEVTLLAAPEADRLGVNIVGISFPSPLKVNADSDLLKQALLNVVINGVQAMPDGGSLRLEARRVDDRVEIVIQDHGPGIPPEIRDRIFNLYFTTKAKGSGIGLAMTYRVMQLHNGSVDFESTENHGATFHLRLPSSGSSE